MRARFFYLCLSLVAFLQIGTLFSSFAFCQELRDWPQWRGSNRDGVWEESGIVDRFDKESLKVVWRQKIGSGYSGPTVANGLVYVMDRQTEPKQTESVICFDQKTGKKKWQHQYDATYSRVGYGAGPRASVTVDDGLAYSLGTMGHLFCLNAKTGKILWQRDLQKEHKILESGRMPIWGISTSPIIFENLVIIQLGANQGASIVAFDRKSGEQKWKSLSDRGQYSSPILVQQNGNDVLVCWTGDNVVGLNPESGKVYWKYPFKPSRMPIGVATPIVKDNQIFLTSFYDGALMLRMKKGSMDVEKVWYRCGVNERTTEAIQSIISTPIWIDDHIYGVDSYGELRCLKAENGDRVWENLNAVPRSRWSTIHFVPNGDNVWMFNERGELILGKLTPKEMIETCRAKLLEPTKKQLRQRGGVCWSHPAFAHRHIFLRNDFEIICVDLSKDK